MRYALALRARAARYRLVGEIVLAGAIALLAAGTIADLELTEHARLAVVLALLQTLPVAWIRRWPLAVLVITGGSLVAHYAVGLPSTTGLLGPALASYGAAVSGPRRASPVVAGVLCLGTLGAALADGDAGAGEVFAIITAFGAPWLVGARIRRTRERTAALEERAVRAEAEREIEAQRAVAHERARLARELHDIVSHAVSVIVVQAGAAGRLLDRAPDEVAPRLAAIEGAGREAMAELRRLLEVLRGDEDLAAGSLEPQPGCAALPALVERFRDSGLPVRLTVAGEPYPLPASLDLSVYRIAQESLTNALRHARATEAVVMLRYAPAAVEIAVSDDGVGGATSPREGHGLIGIRERVAVFGGTVAAGPQPHGGFAVTASLPIPGNER
jgi:signal transduction histidine kinase